ncbi:hypothetical protein LTR36_004522 [Oleoguttula mirabilis]|uniref:Uncharacterized protein n=1 Tax=Oleoguttula mirabilis TaxID=1507867 RepID=A0AAV9JFK6_9PEZI|nr:hypothetical protein LTR36_004522 [Oleoguttula mirabilis]
MADLLSKREGGCQDAPQVLASIIKDPTGIVTAATTHGPAVQVLHFVVLDKEPEEDWLEGGFPDPATEELLRSRKSRRSHQETASPTRGTAHKRSTRELLNPADDGSAMTARVAIATPEDMRVGIDGKFMRDRPPHGVRRK